MNRLSGSSIAGGKSVGGLPPELDGGAGRVGADVVAGRVALDLQPKVDADRDLTKGATVRSPLSGGLMQGNRQVE